MPHFVHSFYDDLLYVGKQILYFETIHSTNSWLLDNKEFLQKEGLVVIAKKQTQGRGKQERVWDSGQGEQLFTSFVIHLPQNIDLYPSTYGIWVGLAVQQALQSLQVQNTTIKWPNDILIHNKKVAGILCEQTKLENQQTVIVAGIGINLQGNVKQFHSSLHTKATTIEQETNLVLSPITVYQAIATKLDTILMNAFQNKTDKLVQLWQQASSSLGKNVIWQENSQQKQGMIVGISERGGILIKETTTHKTFEFVSIELTFADA